MSLPAPSIPSLPQTACMYYGKLFLKTYVAAGGTRSFATAVDEKLEAAIIHAAKFAAGTVVIRRIRGFYSAPRITNA